MYLRDARDAQSEMNGSSIQIEVLALCVGVSFRLSDKTYTIISGNDIEQPSIGKELWRFLHCLPQEQWASLEGRLRSDVQW
jgi:hypothetical protein